MLIPAILATPTGGVLVASPSTLLREQVRHRLDDHSWPVQEATGGADALQKLETGDWQLLYLDRRLPDLDVEELIAIVKRRFPGIAVVMLDSDSGKDLPEPDHSRAQESELTVATASFGNNSQLIEVVSAAFGTDQVRPFVYQSAPINERWSRDPLQTHVRAEQFFSPARHRLEPQSLVRGAPRFAKWYRSR